MDKCVYGLTELPEDTILYVPTLAKDEVMPECTKWSGAYPIPKIGDPVHIRVNRLGDATVLNYAVEYGWLLVHCRLHNAPEWHSKQHPPSSRHHNVATVTGFEVKPVRSEPEVRT